MAIVNREVTECRNELETRVSVLESLVAAQDKLFHQQRLSDQAALSLQRESDYKALELQRAIDQRHFESLNGEQARLASFQSNHLRREVFDVYREQLDKQIVELREYKANIEGRIWIVGLTLGTVGSVIGGLISFFLRK